MNTQTINNNPNPIPIPSSLSEANVDNITAPTNDSSSLDSSSFLSPPKLLTDYINTTPIENNSPRSINSNISLTPLRRPKNLKNLQLDLTKSPSKYPMPLIYSNTNKSTTSDSYTQTAITSPPPTLPLKASLYRTPSLNASLLKSPSSPSSQVPLGSPNSQPFLQGHLRHRSKTLALTIPTDTDTGGGLKTGMPLSSFGKTKRSNTLFGSESTSSGNQSNSIERSTPLSNRPNTTDPNFDGNIVNNNYFAINRSNHNSIKPQTITNNLDKMSLNNYPATESQFISNSNYLNSINNNTTGSDKNNCNGTALDESDPSNYRYAYLNGPQCVLEPNLYLYSEPNKEELKSFDVIINVANELSDHSKYIDELNSKIDNQDDKKQYIFIPWSHTSRIASDFPRLCDTIDKALQPSRPLNYDTSNDDDNNNNNDKNNDNNNINNNDNYDNKGSMREKKVLIHCQCGVSRSASLILAYFMKYYKIGYIEAYNKLKLKAPKISPNMTLIYELMEWGKILGYGVTGDNSSSELGTGGSSEGGFGFE